MGFEDFKFNSSMFVGEDIASLSDTPSADGMTAYELKRRFDNIPKMMIALGKFNDLLDYLSDGGYISNEEIERALTGVITTHSHKSSNVYFDDGQTFQQKFDSKELQGPRGYEGLLGPAGPQGVGIQGPPGPQGSPGVVVTTEINGAYQFSVEEGNLYVSYAGDVPPAFTLEDGKLYLTV